MDLSLANFHEVSGSSNDLPFSNKELEFPVDDVEGFVICGMPVTWWGC